MSNVKQNAERNNETYLLIEKKNKDRALIVPIYFCSIWVSTTAGI